MSSSCTHSYRLFIFFILLISFSTCKLMGFALGQREDGLVFMLNLTFPASWKWHRRCYFLSLWSQKYIIVWSWSSRVTLSEWGEVGGAGGHGLLLLQHSLRTRSICSSSHTMCGVATFWRQKQHHRFCKTDRILWRVLQLFQLLNVAEDACQSRHCQTVEQPITLICSGIFLDRKPNFFFLK